MRISTWTQIMKRVNFTETLQDKMAIISHNPSGHVLLSITRLSKHLYLYQQHVDVSVVHAHERRVVSSHDPWSQDLVRDWMAFACELV